MFVSDLNIWALATSHALFALLVCVQLIGRERKMPEKSLLYNCWFASNTQTAQLPLFLSNRSTHRHFFLIVNSCFLL